MKRKHIEELKRIQRRFGGDLRPSDVEKAARDPKNPLHDAFEWDDPTAALEYRLNQARALIRGYYITIKNTPSKKKLTIRYYVSDPDVAEGYKPAPDVKENPGKAQRSIHAALRPILSQLETQRDLATFFNLPLEADLLSDAMASVTQAMDSLDPSPPTKPKSIVKSTGRT